MISIIMGSDSDLPVMSNAASVVESFSYPYEISIVSAHRTPERMFEYAKDARKRSTEVIIAGAGGAAHLPGMVAALTSLPVIGVPVKTSFNDGLDSALSILQMPRGVPVATVAINNSTNAALLALRIIAVFKPDIADALDRYRTEMQMGVMETVHSVSTIGWKEHLKKRENSDYA